MKLRHIFGCILLLLIVFISLPTLAMVEDSVYGPEKFIKSGRGPIVYTDTFTVNGLSGPGELNITNHGNKWWKRIRFAKIWINGEVICKPNDFKGFPKTIKKVINLQETNEIKVKLWGIRGKRLSLEVIKEVAVNITLDEVNSVSTEITRDGGTITTTDSDGTIYSLEIPTDAYLEQDALTITMTPIKSASGLPAGGSFVVGVRLQPNSLQFFKPAVLTIQPPFTPIPDNTFGIVYRGLYGDYYTYPLFSIEEPDSTVTFHITHFSDWIAWTTDFCPQISAPSFTQDIYKNALACTLMTVGIDPSIAYPILLDWFNDFVFPSLASAFDLVSLDQSILRYIEWSEHVIWFNLFEQFGLQHNSAKSEIQYTIDQLLIEMDIKCRQPNTVCEKETIYLDANKLFKRAAQILSADVEMTVPDIHVFCDNLSEGLVQSVEVGLSGNLKPGETIDLIAILKNAINQQIYNYDGPISWSSSDGQIARIETTYINENNVNAATFMLLSEGEVDIMAVAGCDKHDTFSITVENPVPSEVASVEIQPSSASIYVNDSLSLNVIVRDLNGINLGGCPGPISWTIPSGIISFNYDSQVVTGVSEGTATITATCEEKSGSATVTVQAQALPCYSAHYEGALSVDYNCIGGIPAPCENWVEMGPSGTYDIYAHVQHCPRDGWSSASMGLIGDIYYNFIQHTVDCISDDRSLVYHDTASMHLGISGSQLSGSTAADGSSNYLFGWTNASFYGYFTEDNVSGTLVFDWWFPFACSETFEIDLHLFLMEER